MSVMDVVKLNSFVDSHLPENYLNQFHNFSEVCYLNNSFNARLTEFIVDLSLFLKTDVHSIKQHFKIVAEYCAGLLELSHQIYSQINQLSFILKSVSPHQELASIDSETFSIHYNCFVESIIEYLCYLSEYVDINWVYSPVQIQEFITKISNVDNGIDPEVLSSDILKQYEESKSCLQLSISRAHQKYYGSPVIPFPSFDSLDSQISADSLVSAAQASSLFDTTYNLSAILDKILQNQAHDAVERGEPVGREFW